MITLSVKTYWRNTGASFTLQANEAFSMATAEGETV